MQLAVSLDYPFGSLTFIYKHNKEETHTSNYIPSMLYHVELDRSMSSQLYFLQLLKFHPKLYKNDVNSPIITIIVYKMSLHIQ